jgi:ribonuclease HI
VAYAVPNNLLKLDLVDSLMCPFCSSAEEDVEHIFLSCPAWAHIRCKFPHVDLAQVRLLPACTKLCAVPLLPRDIISFPRNLSIEDTLEVSSPLTELDYAIETIHDSFVFVWTDGACSHQESLHLRRAGYGVAYDPHGQHCRTVSRPLVGLEQTAQRAELRAVLAAVAIESRPLHVGSDSQYVVHGVTNLLKGYSLPFDGEHHDLWVQIEQFLLSRTEPFTITWVKGHATQEQVELGISSSLDKEGNDAADRLAVAGAAQHSCSSMMEKQMQQHISQSVDLALMYTEIACARTEVAKKTTFVDVC